MDEIYCTYKNLFPSISGEGNELNFIQNLVGKTRLASTHVIDAQHILSLIGSKVTSTNGIQTIVGETLRIIYEQIQELSDMGNDEQARLLKAFVDDQLVPGHLSSSIDFDVALLMRSFSAFIESQPVPYRDEIATRVNFPDDYPKMTKLKYKNELLKELSKWMAQIKKKYN